MVPIPAEIFKQYGNKLQRKVKVLEGLFEGQVTQCDENLNCGFLTKDHKCAIYEKRPEVCQLFGEPGATHPMLICKHKNPDAVFLSNSSMKR